MGGAEGIHERRDDRSPVGAWVIVIALLFAYALSFVDRQILSLLVDDLRRDLGLTDTQIGLLQGPAFGAFYAVMGLPFGWLADRVHRIRLIAAGLLCWTAMTMLGGFTHSFGALLVTRMGVGIGEAALVPAAVSLLADSFAPDRRALPLATFTAGVSAGAGAALVVGGALVALAAGGGAATLPFIGPWLDGRAAWQIVLILAGLLGLPLAAAILLLPEPARQRGPSDDTSASLTGFVRTHRSLFARMLFGAASLYIFSYALGGWMPALFIRQFGWSPAEVGTSVGPSILVAAIGGNLASGLLATTLVRRGHANGTLLTMVAGAAILTPLAILAPLAPAPALTLAGIGATYFALALTFGVATASFVAVTPAPLRGRMTALYLSLGNLVGMGLGPPAVGAILDRALHDPARVGTAIALVALPVTVIGTALLASALGLHRRRAG